MRTGEVNGSRGAVFHPDGLTSRGGRLLGDLLIGEGLITESQLREALRVQRSVEPHKPVGQILVDRKSITQEQLDTVLDKHRNRYRLGEILVEAGVITEAQLEMALQHQKKVGLRLGYVLVKLNLVTEEQMKQALCQQLNIAFVDLDKVVVDPSVAQLINRPYAQKHRVIPIARTEGTLTVAMDDPTDVAVVEALKSSTGHKVSVVTATHAALQRALVKVYEQGSETGPTQQYEERRRAHERLSREHQDAINVLTELRAAHEALLREREASAPPLQTLEARNEANDQALAELRTAHEALRRTHEMTVSALCELEKRHEALLETRQCAAEGLEGILRRLRVLP